jgi:hypothetical protein
MSQSCPGCGTESSGHFCSSCGVALDASCGPCGARLVPGARFCNECGAAAGATPKGTAAARLPALPMAVAAVALAVAIGAFVLPRLTGDEAAAPVQAALTAPVDPDAFDLAAMSPREAADRLYNRVMEGVSSGDTSRVGFFTDMALQAYGIVTERDADLHYHVAELHLSRGDAVAARAQADTILAADPQHLFGLYAAAQAEGIRGDEPAARNLFQRFLDGYAAEVARALPEYQDHSAGLPMMRGRAEEAVGRR